MNASHLSYRIVGRHLGGSEMVAHACHSHTCTNGVAGVTEEAAGLGGPVGPLEVAF